MNVIVRISIFVIAVCAILFLFSKHVALGIAAIIASIAYFIYKKRPSFYMAMANAARQRGDSAKALELYRKAYELNPRQSQPALLYGYFLLKSGDIERADHIFTEFLKEETDKTMRRHFHMNVALVRWKQQRLDEAIALLEQVSSHMKTTVLYGSLGYLYIESGDLDKALTYNLEAYEYNDNDAVIADNLLLTYILLGNREQAEQTLEKLLALKPSFPESYYHHGLVLMERGDLQGAAEQFAAALERPFTAVSTESRETVEAKLAEVRLALGDNG